eukprot:4181848-Amphidinium_carterae.1
MMGPPGTSVPQQLPACRVFPPTSPAIASPTIYVQAAFASPPPRLWWGPPQLGVGLWAGNDFKKDATSMATTLSLAAIDAARTSVKPVLAITVAFNQGMTSKTELARRIVAASGALSFTSTVNW